MLRTALVSAFSLLQILPPATPPSASAHDQLRAERRQVLREMRRLQPHQELRLYLGSSLPTRNARGRDVTPSEDQRLRALLRDPAIAGLYLAVWDGWLWDLEADLLEPEPLYRDTRGLVQLKVMIARNLYFRGQSATRRSVSQAYRRIIAQRNRFRSLPVFSHRETLFVVSNQVNGVGEPLFGREKARRLVAHQEGPLTLLRTDGPRRLAKRQLAREVAAANHLTLLFEGHGLPGRLAFGGGLSPREVAQLLASKIAEGREQTLVILSSCFGHDFARRLLTELERLDGSLPKPIVIVPEEYGQLLVQQVYDPHFLRQGLGLERDGRRTLGDLFSSRRVAMSVYVPDGSNLPVQIL